MADKFEIILDECIRLVLQGVPVSECLARYPEYAAKLEPQLTAVKRMADVYSREPGKASFARSRQRLQTEMAALEQAERERMTRVSPWTDWFRTGTRRWATVAVALMLVILITGAGAVAASANALPGELLYPMKQAAEQTRLAFTFTDRSKAEFHLVYAERRAAEMSALIRQGNTTSVEETASRMEEHLVASGQLAARAGHPEAVLFKAELDDSAALNLGRLETAINQAPEETRQQLVRPLAIVKEGYARAAKALQPQLEPTPTPPPVSVEPPVTPTVTSLPPSPSVEPTPVLPPTTPAPTPGVEPTATLPPIQVVEISGTVQSLGTGQFTVEGQIVVITASTEVSGIITPGATVSITGTSRADGAILASRIEVVAGVPPLPTPTIPVPLPTPTPPVTTPTPTPPTTPSLTPTPTPAPQPFVIVGRLTSISPFLWVVDGSQVVVTSDTAIQGLPLPGAIVRVEGFIQADGRAVATLITVLP